MGSCYSNLAAAHQYFIQQQQTLSFNNENNNITVDSQESPKIDSKIEKLSKQHTIHSQNPSLKLINKTFTTCDSTKVIGRIDEHQKCLDYSYKKKINRRKRSSSSSSCSTNRNNSLPSTPSKQQQLSSPSKKNKKKRQLFRRIRETVLNNKRSTNFRINKHQPCADDNAQTWHADDNKSIEETLINTYQVSFVPATSELFEIVCISSDTDEGENRKEDPDDTKQVALFARIKNRFSLRNIANLTKSGRWKNNQRKGKKDSHAPKENYLDEEDDCEREKYSDLKRNEDKMSQLKHPFRSNVQSMINSNSNNNNNNDDNGNNGTTQATLFGGKIISSGFVRKKTEQFQTLYNEMDNLQKFSNNNDNNNCQSKSKNNLDRAQPYQSSKLLPPTNVGIVTSTSNSIFRGLRSRIPSMITKSTGNVNGELHQSTSNQQQQQQQQPPRFIKNANIRGTTAKTARTAEATSSSTATNLIKPISAPTLSSSCCSSSSSSSSTSSLNQPIKPPIFKSQISKSLKPKKLLSNLKPPTATNVAASNARTLVRKSSSSSNLLTTEKPPSPPSAAAAAPALPPKPSAAITQAKTVLSIESKQAHIVSMATKTSAEKESRQNSTFTISGLAPPDMNRIGIPIMKLSQGPPILSTQTSQRQQQRLQFLYGIQPPPVPQSPVHPIVPRIFGSQPQPQPLPVPAINKSSLMFNNNSNHNSIAQHYQRDNNNKYPSKGEHSMMMTSRIKTNHASTNHPETATTTTSLAYMPYSRQQPAMKKSTLPTTNGIPMVQSMANRNKPSMLYGKPQQQQYSGSSRPNQNRNQPTFSKANYNTNNNNQSYRKNTEDLNGNFLSKPNPTTSSGTTGTLEEFFVAKNFSRNQFVQQVVVGKEISPIIGINSATLTKRRMVNNNNDNDDNVDDDSQMIKQNQFNDALILTPSDSDHLKTMDGTFSACSSMVEDEDEDGLSTCSVRTEDFLPNKQSQDRHNMNQMSSMVSSGSTGSNPCSVSICSTASTTSSFVFDPNRGSRNGHSHQSRPRFRTGSTSTSSCSNRDLFLIDDEIADQPALMISGNGNESNIEEKRLENILNLSDLVDEKNWLMSPTKTLTPSSTSNTMTTVSSNNDSPVVNHHHHPTTTSSSCELMLQSLNHELDNLILQTNIDYQSLPLNNGDNIPDPNGNTELPVVSVNSSQLNSTKAGNQRMDRIGSSSSSSSCKLRKRHSYTSSSSSSNSTSPGHHHVPVMFRRPRPLSFVEKDDGSFGLDTPSLRAVAQDLIGIKTLLFRLQNVLQNAETQNPFGPMVAADRPSPRSSSHEWSDKLILGSETNQNDQQSLMQMLREEIFDLKQHNQLLEQQMIEKDRTIRLLQQQMAKYTTNAGTSIIEPLSSTTRRPNVMVDYHNVGDGCSNCCNRINNNNNVVDFSTKSSTNQLMNSTTQTEPRDYNYPPRMSTMTNTTDNRTADGQDSINNNMVDNGQDSVKC